MKYEEKKLSELVDTISDTRKIDKDEVVLVNTSDVLAGEVLNHTYTENCNLRGQFKKRFKPDDILYSEIRPANKRFAYVDFDSEDYIASTKLMVLRRKSDKITNRYLYYCLTNDLFVERMQHLAEARSGTFPQITFGVLKGESIYLPSIDDQNKITSILDNINNKIRLNNEINNNLHELEKNLYKEYFKDLSDDNTKKLGELCNIKYGKGLPTTKIEKEGYPVYGGNGIIGYYHEFMYDNSQVLISCRGAASGNVIISKPKSFVTNNSLILECDRKYHYYLKQYSLDNYYYEYTTGSAQPQITIDNIKDIVLSIPSDELLESFNKQMENLELKYFSNLEEISKLEQLRDTLLPKLMNGEIDLDKIEI